MLLIMKRLVCSTKEGSDLQYIHWQPMILLSYTLEGSPNTSMGFYKISYFSIHVHVHNM